MSPALQAVSWVTSRFFLQLNHQRSPPSASGHVGSFHVLAVVNSAIMNIGVHVSFDLWFPLDICPQVGLQNHMLTLFLVFQGTSTLFSIVAAPVYIPTNSVEASFKRLLEWALLTLLFLSHITRDSDSESVRSRNLHCDKCSKWFWFRCSWSTQWHFEKPCLILF